MFNRFEDRIQTLFERFIGIPASSSFTRLPMPLTPRRLPDHLQQPACWRRSKRIGASGASRPA